MAGSILGLLGVIEEIRDGFIVGVQAKVVVDGLKVGLMEGSKEAIILEPKRMKKRDFD